PFEFYLKARNTYAFFKKLVNGPGLTRSIILGTGLGLYITYELFKFETLKIPCYISNTNQQLFMSSLSK
ncbi:MAG TPA: hypothetical protein VEX17_01480, partial [Bacillales bacterium]|nr:hypothetical protein [Bacillales bacterium]